MRNPIKWVQGWETSTRRYVIVSILLTYFFFGLNDMLPSNLIGWLLSPLILAIFVPCTFFLLAALLDFVHHFIHWIEDEGK